MDDSPKDPKIAELPGRTTRGLIMRITIKLVLILALVSTPAVAENLFVPSQFGTIQAAVNAASPGDRILVAAGDYVGASIDKPVTILGVGDQTIITHGPTFPMPPLIFFQDGFALFPGADGTKIRDLTIKLSPGAVGDVSPLALTQVGIFSTGVSGGTADNIRCIALNRCIDVRFGNEWKITNNTVEGLNSVGLPFGAFGRPQAITLRQTSDSLIAFNTITHASQNNAGKTYIGIDLFGPAKNNQLIQNEIAIDAPGSAFPSSDIHLRDTSAIVGGPVTIFNNKIIGNGDITILLRPALLSDHNVIH
jgi:hypothetical protein